MEKIPKISNKRATGEYEKDFGHFAEKWQLNYFRKYQVW